MLSFSGYFEGIRLLLLGQMIPGDGILPPSRRIHADPDGIDLLELLVMRARKLPAIRRGNHAAAIVYSIFPASPEDTLGKNHSEVPRSRSG